MLMAFIYEPFIYLITEAQGVMFDAEICNSLQLTPTEYLEVEESFRILKCIWDLNTIYVTLLFQ